MLFFRDERQINAAVTSCDPKRYGRQGALVIEFVAHRSSKFATSSFLLPVARMLQVSTSSHALCY